MGYYDGLAGTTEASAWAVADAQDIPVVLVVRPAGSSVTLAAQILGMMHFRRPSHIVGLLLTDCKPMLYAHLQAVLERETGLPVLGYLPAMAEAEIPSRHLGLVTAAEIADLSARFDAIAAALEEHVDLDALLALAGEVGVSQDDARSNANEDLMVTSSERTDQHGKASGAAGDAAASNSSRPRCRIAVARDDAFSFYYQDNLDLLETAGAELVYVSPLQDAALPEVDGLYLGGGYPELHLEALSQNASMRESIRQAVADGLPTVAECGGFLYLQQAMQDANVTALVPHAEDAQAEREAQGTTWPMAGVLPGTGYRTDRLQRFGYLTLTAEQDSLLLRAGEKAHAHEFHYWDCTECGTDLAAAKADGRSWRCGYVNADLYAAFPHFHWGGELPMAERFVQAAAAYREAHARENA